MTSIEGLNHALMAGAMAAAASGVPAAPSDTVACTPVEGHHARSAHPRGLRVTVIELGQDAPRVLASGDGLRLWAPPRQRTPTAHAPDNGWQPGLPVRQLDLRTGVERSVRLGAQRPRPVAHPSGLVAITPLTAADIVDADDVEQPTAFSPRGPAASVRPPRPPRCHPHPRT